MRKSRLFYSVAATIVLTSTFPVITHAQDANEVPQAEEDTSDEIVVTARRRDETLIEVPIAI